MTNKKVTLILDDAWFNLLAQMFDPSLREDGETLSWESIEEIV